MSAIFYATDYSFFGVTFLGSYYVNEHNDWDWRIFVHTGFMMLDKAKIESSALINMLSATGIDQINKSHNAPVPYPSMQHFGTEMGTFLFQTGALRDIEQMHCRIWWDWSIFTTSSRGKEMLLHL